MSVVIRNVVGRLHVSASNVDVVRAMYRALERRFRKHHGKAQRKLRKRIYRDAIKQHALNRRLFLFVAHGR